MCPPEVSPEPNGALLARLDHLERALEEQSERLRLMESRLERGARREFEPPASRGYGAPTRQNEITALPADHSEAILADEGITLVGPGETIPVSQIPSLTSGQISSWSDLESRIGGRWFNWIGIVAMAFGVAFFLKYAFDNRWIGPWGRVGIGFILGLAFLTLAERLRLKGMRAYAHVLSGGGILILYLSAYAAGVIYPLIGHGEAFLVMTGVTALAVLLARRYHALPIGVIGLVGGFLTPILLSTGIDNEAILFSYIGLLDCGVLMLAYFEAWCSLNYLAFVATLLMVAGWMVTWYAPGKFWITLLFVTGFFILFLMVAVFQDLLRARRATFLDIGLISATATSYFGASYYLLNTAGYHAAIGSFTLLLSACYIVLYYLAFMRRPEAPITYLSYLGAGITFITLAIAIQLNQNWITIGWATEALVLVWLGLRAEIRASRYAALPVFLIALAHWILIDVPAATHSSGSAFVPLLNARGASGGALIFALGGAVWAYQRYKENVGNNELRLITPGLILAANATALLLLSVDASAYFETLKARNVPASGGSASFTTTENSKQFTLTTLWAIYGALALRVGVTRGLRVLRFAALALLTAAILKLLLIDIEFSGAPWHTPLLNQTFIGFAVVVTALAFSARLYNRTEGIEAAERRILKPVLLVLTNLLAIMGLSSEAVGYFRATGYGETLPATLQDIRLGQELSLSVVWALYGGVMFVFGLSGRNRLLRIMALVVLGITTLKVFLFDLSSLDAVYRIISFVLLGAILLAISYLYQQRRQKTA